MRVYKKSILIVVLILGLIGTFCGIAFVWISQYFEQSSRQYKLFSAVWRDDTNALLGVLPTIDINIPSHNITHPTPLITAVKLGYLDEVQILLQHGADPNKCDSVGFSALYYSLYENPKSDSSQIVAILIQHGASLRSKGIADALANLDRTDPRLKIYMELTKP